MNSIKSFKKNIVVTAVTEVTVVTKIAQPLKKKKNLFSEHFWKEQFDTFDNRSDVLRAAFCYSRNVFHLLTHSGCMIYVSGRCVIFLRRGCITFLWTGCVIFLLRGCVISCVERLRDFCV